MKLERQYYKVEERGIDNTLARTLYKQCVWQTQPFEGVEITEEEFLHYMENNAKD